MADTTKLHNPHDTFHKPQNVAELKANLQKFLSFDKPHHHLADAVFVGVIDNDIQNWLQEHQKVGLITTATIVIRRQILHAIRETKPDRQKLTDEDIKRFPDILANPEAVLYHKGQLVYVFSPTNPENQRKGKLIVRVNYTSDVRLDGQPRKRTTANSVVTAGYIPAVNLQRKEYVVIKGGMKR
ncbi:MAG: hypothetical protein ACR2PR_10030 [Pseudohongiellaceae bacterium]